MFVLACPMIARSQCWLFALRANIRIIFLQISVFALEYPYCPRIQLAVSVHLFRISIKLTPSKYWNKV